jgi:outer membrane immunogenic protein
LRKILLAATTLIALIDSALAADLPNVKAPPVFTPPAFSWTGVYVGLNAGWASIYDHGDPFCVNQAGVVNGITCNVAIPGAQINANGFLGGGQIGYNWQVSQFVFGIETDFQGAALKGSVYTGVPIALIGGGPPDPPGDFAADERLSWLGTARGRVGFLITPTLLLYGTGGLAYGEVSVYQNTMFTSGIEYPSAASGTRAGWTAGGGFEYAIDPHWSVKLEGLYYDLGSITTSGPGVPITGYLEGKNFSVEGAIVRVGVNYKFDIFEPPAPVVAKY